MRQALLAAALMSLPIPGASQADKGPATLEELGRDKERDEFLEFLARFEQATDRVARERHLACLQAFGAETFCACLRDELPVGATFDTYIEVVTATRDEVGYDSLPSDLRAAIDRTLATRDACVKRSHHEGCP
jgi:hypothetical protein